jgi:hypothetical protein
MACHPGETGASVPGVQTETQLLIETSLYNINPLVFNSEVRIRILNYLGPTQSSNTFFLQFFAPLPNVPK